MFRVARKNRVGRETGNTHIFFSWPNDTSHVIRNPNILHMRKQRRRCCNRAANQRLCFCYIDTVFPLLPKSEIQPLAIFCGSTARFVSDLVGYYRIQVLAENLFPHDMFFVCLYSNYFLSY